MHLFLCTNDSPSPVSVASDKAGLDYEVGYRILHLFLKESRSEEMQKLLFCTYFPLRSFPCKRGKKLLLACYLICCLILY